MAKYKKADGRKPICVRFAKSSRQIKCRNDTKYIRNSKMKNSPDDDGYCSCGTGRMQQSEPLKIDNALTTEEIAAGRLTRVEDEPRRQLIRSRPTARRFSTSRPTTTWRKPRRDHDLGRGPGLEGMLRARRTTRPNNVSPMGMTAASYFLSDPLPARCRSGEMTAASFECKQLSIWIGHRRLRRQPKATKRNGTCSAPRVADRPVVGRLQGHGQVESPYLHLTT